LTREVVHDSILTRRRKELHATVAEALEQTYQPNLTEHLGALCDHFIAGENYEKGEIYAKLAVRKAQKGGSIPEAIVQAKKRVICLEKLPLTDEGQKKMIDARTVLALYLAQLNYYFEAKETIAPIIDLAVRLSYQRRLCQIKTILGAYYAHVEENFPSAFQAFEEALTIAEEVKDLVSLALASYWFGSNLAFNCEFEKASRYQQKALDISVAAGYLPGMASFKASFAYFSFFLSGKITLGFRTSAEAVRLAEESGDSYSKGLVYTIHGIFCYGRGLFEKAEEYLLRGVGLCKRVNEKLWNSTAHFTLGETYFEKGDFLRSEECFRKAYELLKDSRLFPSFAGCVNVGVIRAKAMIKPKEIDLESLYALSKNIKLKVNQGLISSYIGAILMNLDGKHASEAEAWIQKAIEEDQRNGTRFFLGRDYALYAKWFKRKGDCSQARENLGRAVEIFKECGADGWVEKAERKLAEIS
jgi:tetratricopeptide (TPR) repeat protein